MSVVSCRITHLNLARLPIPPHPHVCDNREFTAAPALALRGLFRPGRCIPISYRIGRRKHPAIPRRPYQLLAEFELEEEFEDVLDRRAVVVYLSIGDVDSGPFVNELVPQGVIVAGLIEECLWNLHVSCDFLDDLRSAFEDVPDARVRVLFWRVQVRAVHDEFFQANLEVAIQ